MNENTIKVIEEHLRLRHERLALREKEFGLKAKKWRTWGITLAIVALLAICGTAVCFGGMGLYKLSGKILNSSPENKPETTPCTLPKGILSMFGKSQAEINHEQSHFTVPANSLAVVSPPSGKQTAIVVQAESEMISDNWPLVIAAIMNGLLVVTGLGVAAYTVKNIAKHNNELE